MQLSKARRPLHGQLEVEPADIFSKAGTEVKPDGSPFMLPAHSAVHEVSTGVTCRGSAGSPEIACDVDRPPASGGAGLPDAASGVGGVDAEELSRKCQGAYPVRPSNKPLKSKDIARKLKVPTIL